MAENLLESKFFTIIENMKVKTGQKDKLENLLAYLCEQIVLSLEFPCVWIGLKEDNGLVKCLGSAGESAQYLETAEVRWDDTPLGHGALGQAIKSGKVHFMEVKDNDRLLPWLPILRKLKINTLLSIPVICQGNEVAGAFTICSQDFYEFTEAKVAILNALALHIAMIIDLERTSKLLDKYRMLLKNTQDMKKEMTAKVTYLTTHDMLTELPNRTVFTRKLRENLEKKEKEPFAVLFLDIDHFKYINDNYGHEIGDILLVKVAERIKKSLNSGDIVCRYGGDEFAIIINSRTTPAKIFGIAARIINRCFQRFRIRGLELYVSLSMGIAIHPDNGKDTDSLIKHADIAMYSAKKNGGNRYQVYVSEEETQRFKSFSLLGNLNKALKNDQFSLYYQPQLELLSGKVKGVEALIRWFSPAGLINPADFIPLAEDTGLIVPIGEWVIRTACLQNIRWQASGWNDLKISVNISAKQFYQPDFVSTLAGILIDTKLDPKMLNIEITESIAMKNFELAAKIIQELSNLGLNIAIDDFGTGYSSLNYLAHLELDYLKIDKSLIANLHTQGKKGSVVKGIITMAHNLEMKVIAEGVEKKEELDFLKAHKCDLVQGLLIGHPLPVPQVEKDFKISLTQK